MTQPMKLLRGLLLAGALITPMTSCKVQDFLDVNVNPNGPSPATLEPKLYLPAILHWTAASGLYDARFTNRYTQAFHVCCTQTWDAHGYDNATNDNAGTFWRTVYWTHGQNLVDLITKAEAAERWDLAGAGNVIKAWDWLMVTDMHGEVIIKQSFDQTRYYFDYDSQEYAYSEVLRLLNKAISQLKRTDGKVDQTYWRATDNMYGGDAAKWMKFAYGLRAIALNHYSNKSTYSPSAVIASVDSSFASNADDAQLKFPGTDPSNNGNPWGPQGPAPLGSYRQGAFVVQLMNGTQTNGTVDPRMSRMLAPSADGQYRGYDVNATTTMPTATVPANFYGYTSTPALGTATRFLFDNKSTIPVVTYAELQFVKAEAAYRAGDKATALTAYKNALAAHIDFVNARNLDAGQTPTQITAAEKTAFLNDPNIVPASAANLNLTQIMTQKYIALWPWGSVEMWMDMRRYHYTDIEAATGKQVYAGYALPITIASTNGGKPAYRVRPRYNSEYVWNLASLTAIGATAADYNTKPLWIVNP